MIILAYIKSRKKVWLGLLAVTAAFALVFYLYRLPPAAAGYGGLLAFFLLALLAAGDFSGFAARHTRLQAVAKNPYVSQEELPEAADIVEEDYQAIIQNLCRDREELAGKLNSRYSGMMEYYTTWVHQIKTPIAAMYLLLQNEQISKNRELQEELLKIEQYVEMVLGYLRLESEATDYVIKNCDLDTIVRQAVRKFASQFIRKKIRLEYDALDCQVLTDEKWLLFVVEQVLSNALKYTRSGSVSISLEENKTLTIQDTGIGISPQDLPRIFEKGYTGYNGRSDKKASGIGLYLCRRICGRLGHTITVWSEPGKGTAVRIGLKEARLEIE